MIFFRRVMVLLLLSYLFAVYRELQRKKETYVHLLFNTASKIKLFLLPFCDLMLNICSLLKTEVTKGQLEDLGVDGTTV
jgi:hypothetical protein